MKWKTKDGVDIEVKDMDTDHIINSMKLIEEKSFITRTEYTDHGYDGDSYVPDFIRRDYKMTERELVEHSPIYREMGEELLKRKLSNQLKK